VHEVEARPSSACLIQSTLDHSSAAIRRRFAEASSVATAVRIVTTRSVLPFVGRSKGSANYATGWTDAWTRRVASASLLWTFNFSRMAATWARTSPRHEIRIRDRAAKRRRTGDDD
jgi:hypothetical protein